jgi:hypothetical protein
MSQFPEQSPQVLTLADQRKQKRIGLLLEYNKKNPNFQKFINKLSEEELAINESQINYTDDLLLIFIYSDMSRNMTFDMECNTIEEGIFFIALLEIYDQYPPSGTGMTNLAI